MSWLRPSPTLAASSKAIHRWACPPIEKDAKQWLVPMEAQRENQLSALIEFIPEEMRPSEVEMGETNPFPDMLWEITVAYREREAGEFNRSVRRYHAALEDRQPTAWKLW